MWVIGGSHIFVESLPFADRLEITIIRGDIQGDTFAPILGDEWMLEDEQAELANTWLTSASGAEYRFVRYVRKTAPR